MHFKNELLPESYHEFGAKSKRDESHMKKLLLFAGRADGITVPMILQEICENTGIRGNQLGKIICRANKTFINAEPADAEKIIKAFANNDQWRFKYDEPREERSDKRSKKEFNNQNERPGRRGKKEFNNSDERNGKRDKNNSAVREDKPKRKKVKTHKPLREEFFKWIEDSE
jgi:hypothetical protein